MPEPTPGGSGRFASRAEKELRRELLVTPLPELGLVAANGPNDPEPELVFEDGVVTRMDGRAAADFDVIDRFLVAHGIDLDIAAEAMALPDETIARMLVDVDVPRAELVRLARGLTPGKLARVAGLLDPVELMFALKKLRARRAPANQAHVTNLKESPALLAADAAEAAARGFAELETTVGVARYAPLNAISLLVGSQTGRPGVMTQCAVEERRNLQLAISGLVTYAETLSVYGTEQVFVDGDDTPWSKSFLGAAYASRGVKVRFTSGTGSEALMGHAQGMSMLYLEARCISVVRAAGSQGVQNGSISCVALVLAVPGGTRAILAENVIAAWLDLEVASGNDAIASHSAIRKTAKLMGQFLPGTDFVTSGYSVMPRHDNTFGGGNYDADDIDEWLTIQRDWQVDGGIEPRRRGRGSAGPAASGARRAGRVRRARAARRHRRRGGGGDERLRRRRHARPRPRRRRRGGRRRARAPRLGARRRPRARPARLRGRRARDRRHAAPACVGRLPADLGRDRRRRPRALRRQRPEPLRRPRHGLPPRGRALGDAAGAPARGRRARARNGRAARRREIVVAGGAAHAGTDPAEVVIAVGPAFADGIRETINGLDHGDVLAAVLDGIEEAGATPRLVRVRRVADVAFIAHDGACLSGSGVALGIQSKGTAVIHRADLQPLDNLELFGMSPLYSLESYRAMGRNAAGYALGKRVGPVPTELDNFARAKLIVRTTLLHARETAGRRPRRAAPVELTLARPHAVRYGRSAGVAAAQSKPCARCCACSTARASSSSRKSRTSSQTIGGEEHERLLGAS